VRAFALRELAAHLRQAGRAAEADGVEQEVAAIVAAAHTPGGTVTRDQRVQSRDAPGASGISK
ncbi:MAG: hypothetical protein ACRC33_16635, partial [Gemmataceae bacterium]